MTKSICLLLASTISTVASSQISFTLKGNFANQQNPVIYSEYLDKEKSVTDTINVSNNRFHFSKTISEPVLSTLTANNRRTNFFLEDGIIDVDFSTYASPVIQGGPLQKEFENFIFSVKDVLYPLKNIYDSYWWKLFPSSSRDSVYDQLLALRKQMTQKISAYLKTHRNSIIGTWAAAENYDEATSTEFEEILSHINRNHAYGRKVLYLYELAKKTAVGKKIYDQDLAAKDINGNFFR